MLKYVEEIRKKAIEKVPTVNGKFNARERLEVFVKLISKESPILNVEVKDLSIESIKKKISFWRLNVK